MAWGGWLFVAHLCPARIAQTVASKPRPSSGDGSPLPPLIDLDVVAREPDQPPTIQPSARLLSVTPCRTIWEPLPKSITVSWPTWLRV